MILKIKVKSGNEYRLGGVQKIELDDKYLYTTIFDTRKYRRCDIERIEVTENEAVKTATAALEKQIPKKPLWVENSIEYNCPGCGQYCGYVDTLSWDTPRFCVECGQALDWTEEEDNKNEI